MNRDFKNILAVRTDRIGDFTLTTPAIRALKLGFPNAKVTALIVPAVKEIAVGNPFIDDVIVDERKGAHKGIAGFWKLVAEIRKRKFDLAVIFHTKKRTNLACFLAGIPYRTGYKNEKFGFLLNHPLVDKRHEGRKHESELCMDVVRALGVTNVDTQFVVPLNENNEKWVDEFFAQNKLKEKGFVIAIHPGASDPSRRWAPERFAELIDALNKRYKCQLILLATNEMKNLSEKVLSMVKTSVMDLTGQTSVGQMVSLLRRCNLLVSNDTGPVHIATALHMPVVSIFTRNQPGINPERWKPLGEKVRTVSAPLDLISDFRKAGSVPDEYLARIPTTEVLEAVDALLKLC